MGPSSTVGTRPEIGGCEPDAFVCSGLELGRTHEEEVTIPADRLDLLGISLLFWGSTNRKDTKLGLIEGHIAQS